jgi:hypothetical protein
MAEYETLPNAVTPRNGTGDVTLRQFHRVRQIMAARQITRDGRRIGATSAVRAKAFDERRAQEQFRPAIEENVHGFASTFVASPLRRGRHTFQMTAFDKRRAAEARVNFTGGGA